MNKVGVKNRMKAKPAGRQSEDLACKLAWKEPTLAPPRSGTWKMSIEVR